MFILGLLLIAAGALVIVATVFTVEATAGQIELLGTEIGAVTLFLLGVASAVAILVGLSISKLGAKRELRHRRENRKLNELSEKLDRVESDRRGDDHGDSDDPNRSRF